MDLYCNREIISALKDVEFPKTKSEIISLVGNNQEISEASTIALNNLEEKLYKTLDEVCENVKIICNSEVTKALKEIKFPTTKKEIIEYIGFHNYSDIIIKTLDDLPDGVTFNGISDICK
jgi:hypothetical protein